MSFEDIVRLILCKSILLKSEFCINIFNLISNFFAEGQTRIIYLSPPGNLRYLSDITKFTIASSTEIVGFSADAIL